MARPANRNGRPAPPRGSSRTTVSSGLARRSRSPALAALGEVGSGVRRTLLRDPLTTLLLIASLAITIAFFSLLGSIKPDGHGTQVPLSQVTRLAASRAVTAATLLDYDDIVELQTRDGDQLYASYPSSGAQTQTVSQALERGGATVTVDDQAGKATRTIVVQFLLPILLLVCLFAFLTRLGQDAGAGGIAAFSKFTGRGRKKGKGTTHKITFADIAGAGEAVAELREIRDFLADPSRYLALGAAAPKGVLLVGPPGTGKTLLAKAVAGEADASFFSLSGSDFVESLVGVGAARVRDLFARARRQAPAIIFIDEFDAAGRKRGAGIGQGNDEREQTLNQLLVEMDGFSGDGGLVVMGATNRPDILDPALLRPGRFDRQVTVDTPDVHGRLEILRLYARKRPLAADVELDRIAHDTPGFSGAELASVVNEAALLTVREGRTQVDQRTFEEAIDRVLSGPAKKHLLSEDERWTIAVHEAAHAVASEALQQTTAVRKLSIVARGRTLGTTATLLTDRDALLQREPELQRQLIVVLAGAAGERIEFGCLSTGVHDDLHAATNLARSMVTSFGMSDALGSVTIGEKAGEVFLGASLQDLGQVGPSTLDLIDREVERIVGDAEARALHVLRRSWESVEEIAQALLEHETLSGVALEALLSTVATVELAELDGVRSPRARG
ncbi:ATP-dependent zinc metalloprotease FtsH [Conexibacter sp. JD483]|uniref:ATP-dependent zinc metalloprotease FtsH n=1 Tax=unclassified Conexibacter TaxID=2627773 RepID=UPI00271C594D|nr:MULTISPECIES: ATP-dependent zinc metalloprotease FtsH [unclassified Conexibacter]MDO8186553.1 ATP-dependent zinc metalloprotease FtsH [Conexibacter sp. CPCC 205706]MDO8200122.1 ATP-dependent zinc metalloprotease FtsH [Conexibacter sp. CPCC 205762]MDR9372004.1 ATP-dependent zinc metalloprotease FtsH [Conexibacter sp. JD483]